MENYEEAPMLKQTILRKIRRWTRNCGFDIVRAYPPMENIQLNGKPLRDEILAKEQNRLWVAFSLYGDNPLYVEGIQFACHSYAEIFPGWKPVIYAGRSVPRDVLTRLTEDFGALIIDMSESAENSTAMFWRYLAVDNPGGDAIIFRDADSRASRRERAAVDEWLASTLNFHVMRDHPSHVLPIMGGMWGVHPLALPNVKDLISDYGPDNRFSGDQRWLASIVYPLALESCLVHSDVELFSDSRTVVIKKFPVAAATDTYVGQGITPSGAPRTGH